MFLPGTGAVAHSRHQGRPGLHSLSRGILATSPPHNPLWVGEQREAFLANGEPATSAGSRALGQVAWFLLLNRA
jgi:hypothetical protein